MGATEKTAVNLFNAVKAAAAQLNRVWPKHMSRIGMYAMPVYPRGKLKDLVPDEISPEPQTGRSAIALAKRGIAGFERTNSQHPWSVMRYPGWIALDADLSEIDVLNELKAELHAVIKEIAPSDAARVRLTQRLFPGMAMLQVYRQLYLHAPPVRRLEFTWSPVTYSTQKLDPNDVIQQLERSLQGPPPAAYRNTKTWTAVVRKEIREISQAERGSLILRKPVPPHPKVMVYFDADYATPGPRHDAMHKASVPVFIRPTDQLQVTPLKRFTLDRQRTPKRPSKSFRWISEPLGIALRT